MPRIVKIKKEKRVYDGYTKVDEALIEDTLESGKVSTYSRQKVVRPDAVAGLIYNTDTECVVLVKQHRYPTHFGNRNGFIYEAMAGKIDSGENPKQAFIRESFEEVGYRLKEKNVEYCFNCFTTPGYSTERIHYFLATATNKDKIKNAGGGMEDEHENIEICEFHYLQFRSMMDTMEDAKTKLLAYEAHHRKLFDRK
jgi:nudix-type nucleoside diphosphatase (YffH/AdpP family)